MRFDLKPWDRNRPRRTLPLADCVIEHGGKTFGLRAKNGILFFRDQSDDAKTWTIASPLPSEIENDQTRFEAFWRGEFERGHVARYLVPLVYLHVFNERQIPLFLRGDGTGWARESWNRDDVEFKHSVSLHAWLEGTDETLLGELGRIDGQLREELSNLDFPPDTPRDDENNQIEWLCGSGARLGQILEWVCHLETSLWEGAEVQSMEAEVQNMQMTVSAENSFARAHLHSLGFWPPHPTGGRHIRFEVAQSDEVELSPDEAHLGLSNRFWSAVDLALDDNTPTGVFWEYTDQGSGRCADAPLAPTLSFQFERPSSEQVERARVALAQWLSGVLPAGEIEPMLCDDAPREIKLQKD